MLMRGSISTKFVVCGVVLAAVLGTVQAASAFDPDAGVTKQSGPLDLFRFGFSAYKSGHKTEAAEAYKYAAEKGHAGARWALANMYASGDGIAENDYEAFKIYDEIARKGVEPGSVDTGYFINALMALASYYRHGIPNSPIHIDLTQARQLYFHVASVFGLPDAEFELGRMMLEGKGGEANPAQAKKWLNRARKAGSERATALLGSVICKEGHEVYGLALMTVALKRAGDGTKPWIRDIQEQAFSLANETNRRSAVKLADTMMAQDVR
ncbi:MAG TPA: tetratricopeptide repeat protein [Pararhizobium sp.]|nr:tetratricopeptide repeat protein [Pararhizobium sp.]